MSENQKYPYDDDLMRFDKDLNQYLLTEAALLKFGVDIRARLSATAGISPENEINYAVYRVSNLIYGYIHEHNANNAFRELQEAIRQAYITINSDNLNGAFKKYIEADKDLFKRFL